MNKSILFVTGLLTILCSLSGFSQTLIPDLTKVSNFSSSNRKFDLIKDQDKGQIILVKSAEGPGAVWLEDVNFSTGTVEFDVKGKDVMQQSFVGMAFHGQNDSTYEAIYFRPFNFNSSEEMRRSHSVQYIFLPQFDWLNLRESQPGKYENPLPKPVDPNDWFHVKIMISQNQIHVYVNDWQTEVLNVKPINPNAEGKLGFWVGNGSDGSFANLRVLPN